MSNPKIRYDIEAAVTGSGDVQALARQLDGLADTLEGDLKAQALQSAAALRQLGERQGAIEAFTRLKREAGEAATGLQQAQQQAQAYGREISAIGNPTRAQVGQLEKLRDNVRAAKTELQAKTAALQGARDGLQRYGLSTSNLAAQEQAVRTAIAATRAEVAQMAPAYQRAQQAAAAAGQAQVQAATTSRAALQGLGDSLRAVQNIAITALGGTVLTQVAGDVAKVADQYNNLAARIKLVTGEGAAFEGAFDRVQQIALGTNAALESTGTLFARLAQAGQSAGLGAEAAASQALALTETINQAVAVSGSSAQASDAAITQLIQGLQSGVLRGEEFNSVMEQAPRLAKALADGLGVTTGELRKLANQGALTTDVVINALRGQAQTLQTEFAQLPPTVGRALQNLSTAWTVYVGEADKATGASAAAARAINALSENLDTVAGLLMDVGQAAAAFTAVRLAQTFLGIGTAATASATAIAANATAMQATAAAGTAAAAGAGRLAGILSTLKTFTLVGLLANIQDIGKFLGEGIAKLQGYKDTTEELAKQEQFANKVTQERVRLADEMAQKLRLATDETLGLSKASRGLVSEFDSARQSGKATADVLADMAKKANVIDTTGIQTYIGALQELARTGQATGDQVRDALAQALKGEDLQAFEVRARVALGGAKQEAELLSVALDASLRAAVLRSGASFEVLSGSMGAAARSALNDTETIITGLDRLKTQGVDVSAALQASLAQGLKTADGVASLEALRGQVERVRKAIGDPLAQNFLDQINAKAQQATQQFSTLNTALKQLGITSDADLKRTADQTRNLYDQVVRAGGSVREQAEAYRRMAEAAVASGDAQAIAYAKGQAAARGFEIATDAAGKTTVRAMGEARAAVATVGTALNTVAQQAQQADDYLTRLAKRAADISKRTGVDAEGFTTDKSGQRLSVGSELQTLTGVANFLKNAGLSDQQARDLAQQFGDGRGGIDANRILRQYGQRSRDGTYYTDSTSSALLKAAEQYTFGGRDGGAQGQPSRTVRVELSVGGRSTPVNVSSDQDAQALIDVLRNARLSS